MSLHCISGSHPGWLPTWASTASVALTPVGCLHEPPLYQWLSPQLAAYMSLHCISGSHPSWLPTWASTASVALTPAGCLHEPLRSQHCISGSHPCGTNLTLNKYEDLCQYGPYAIPSRKCYCYPASWWIHIKYLLSYRVNELMWHKFWP